MLQNGIHNSDNEQLEKDLPMDFEPTEEVPQENGTKEIHPELPPCMLNIQIKEEPIDMDEYQ